MKKLVTLSLSGIIFGGSGFAFSEDFCDQAGELAQLIMTRRQEGVPMQEVMKVISPETQDTPNGKLTKSIIIAAYEQPRFNGESLKKSSITDFQDAFYLQCIKSAK